MTDEQNKKLEDLFRAELQKQYLRGIRVGIKSSSKICLDMLNDSSTPFMKRIEKVKKYCSVSMKDDFLKKGIDDANTSETSDVIEAEATPVQSDKEVSTDTDPNAK